MAELDALAATIRAGDSPEARAAIRTLAGVDDERAREVLGEALAGTGPLAALAIRALGEQGARAHDVAIAALVDPDRKLGGVAVLGEIGAPDGRVALRPFVDAPDPLMRLTVAAALYRCGERDGALWSTWILREPDLGVLAFLAAVAGGGVSLTSAALVHLEACAGNAAKPAELRAGAAWAAAQHDPRRGAMVARTLLASPDASFALASVVRRRGGPLTALVASVAGDPATDWTADSVGLPPAAG